MASLDQSRVKSLLEHLQGDFKAISGEAKKKFPAVKEAAERGFIRIRNISSHDEAVNVLTSTDDLIHPLLFSCESKNPKIVQLSLVSLQRLVTHKAVSQTCLDAIVSTLWVLSEAEVESLKVLQTILLLVTTTEIVSGQHLAKIMLLCLHLYSSKDSVVSNTASAAVRQTVSAVFEHLKMHLDDEGFFEMKEESIDDSKIPRTLNAKAHDAYLLFQDLVQLTNGDPSSWLAANLEMNKSLGLELLENVLNSFPRIFHEIPEFGQMLKERVCPLVIKLFSPSIKHHRSVPTSGTHPSNLPAADRPSFPITMRLLKIVAVLVQQYYQRLVTECEIFLSLLVKFIDHDKPLWQRTLAIEVLHVFTTKPKLLKSFCINYDMQTHSTKVFKDIIDALGGFIQAYLTSPTTPVSTTSSTPHHTTTVTGVGGMIAGGTDKVAMFSYRSVSIPVLQSTTQKLVLLEMLDKSDAPNIQESYPLAVAYTALLDAVKSITTAVEDLPLPPANAHCETVAPDEVNEVMIRSSWSGMLAALSLLLSACGDEQVSESFLKAHETYVYLCGKMKLAIPRDAFITELCKGSLPPQYAFTLVAAKIPLPPAVTSPSQTVTDSDDEGVGVTYVFGAHSNEEKGGKKGVVHQPRSETSSVSSTGKGHPPTRAQSAYELGQSVEITAKNLQYMRTLLNLAHCHGDVLTSSWKLVLTTLQHLCTILGLKAQQDGSLKPSGGSSDSTNLTLPSSPGKKSELISICNLLSRLFESSLHISEESLMMLVDAICHLSAENIKNSKNSNLFPIAKLLETGLCNTERVTVIWKPMTEHLLEMCESSDVTLRLYAADALTMLVRVILNKNQEADKKEINMLQVSLILPLLTMASSQHTDVRLKQLECVQQILQLCGQSLSQSWSLILQIISITSQCHSEILVRSGFQGLQLVVTDFLPSLPAMCLPVCVAVAGLYGVQNEDLNISLTSIGLLWNIADFLFQNKSTVMESLENVTLDSSSTDTIENLQSTIAIEVATIGQYEMMKVQSLLGQFSDSIALFDALWMLLFLHLTKLCVDDRPAVRKSASHTLFSTVMAHGPLLKLETWPEVLWKILFPLLTKVNSLAGSASTSSLAGSIMMHHSRDTAHKQWAETQVLSLTGVARLFQSRKNTLSTLDCFRDVWTTFLEYIKVCACNCTEEVAIAAADSFHKTLELRRQQTKRSSRNSVSEAPSGLERKNSVVDNSNEVVVDDSYKELSPSQMELYTTAWKVWASIGKTTIIDRVVVGVRVEELLAANVADTSDQVRALELLVPSQQYMLTYFNCFSLIIWRLRENFTAEDLRMFSDIVIAALQMPVTKDTSPFLVPPLLEYAITSVQDAILRAVISMFTYNVRPPKSWLDSGGSGSSGHITNVSLKVEEASLPLCPAILHELLSYVHWACTEPPKPSGGRDKSFFLSVGYAAFSQTALQLALDLYLVHSDHPAILEGETITDFLKALHLPLKQKCSCPSPLLWKQSLDALLTVLHTGLGLCWEHGTQSEAMWDELASVLEQFLFAESSTPSQSDEAKQALEKFDVKVIDLIKKDILPHCAKIPEDFQKKLTSILNKGSIHTATDVLSGDVSDGNCFRENFARACFEALLQFSFISSKESNIDATSQVALNALLERSREVLMKFTKDEALSGDCPLPRARLNEVSLVLKSVTVLISTLRNAQQDPSIKVDHKVWQNIVQLYLPLVECVTCTSADVRKDLQSTLAEFSHLLFVTSQSEQLK